MVCSKKISYNKTKVRQGVFHLEFKSLNQRVDNAAFLRIQDSIPTCILKKEALPKRRLRLLNSVDFMFSHCIEKQGDAADSITTFSRCLHI